MKNRFTTKNTQIDDDFIWKRILATIDPETISDLDDLRFDISEPFEGYKEYSILEGDNKVVVSASISDVVGDLIYWSIYQEV